MKDMVYTSKTSKSAAHFAKDFARAAEKRGFLIANIPTMDMAKTFTAHGATVHNGFDLHMIQLCKPDKAAMSLQQNPERSVLMPKFVMAFSDGTETQIRFLQHGRETITSLVKDQAFPQSLATTYETITAMIEEAI